MFHTHININRIQSTILRNLHGLLHIYIQASCCETTFDIFIYIYNVV
jgi:hypothetical protein